MTGPGLGLALRELLRALGKDERLCLFVVPILVNMMFMFGLFPFLLGIPIMFWALATSVRYFEDPTRDRGPEVRFGHVAIANDDRTLIAARGDGELVLRDLATGRPLGSLGAPVQTRSTSSASPLRRAMPNAVSSIS